MIQTIVSRGFTFRPRVNRTGPRLDCIGTRMIYSVWENKQTEGSTRPSSDRPGLQGWRMSHHSRVKGESRRGGGSGPIYFGAGKKPGTETDSNDSKNSNDSNDCFPEVLHSGPARIELTSVQISSKPDWCVLPGRNPERKMTQLIQLIQRIQMIVFPKFYIPDPRESN